METEVVYIKSFQELFYYLYKKQMELNQKDHARVCLLLWCIFFHGGDDGIHNVLIERFIKVL